MTLKTFKDLNLVEPILKALVTKGYTNPTPIQEKSIPILLNGTDLLGCAQTGTGKTAAFAIPIIQQLYLDEHRNKTHRKIKALIVTPTRELAIQIADNFTEYGENADIRNTVIFGGVKQGAQTNALRRGVDVLVATPGRLLDLMGQGFIKLNDIEYFVLDEADQMLDLGFIHDIKKLLTKLPAKRQSLFFSATMPKSIVELSEKILGKYERVTISPDKPTAEKVEQALYFVSKEDKPKLLVDILRSEDAASTLVFARTKHGADKVVRLLSKAKITAQAIHGNKSQNARQNALSNFKDGKTKVLIATDIAARGIDVSQLELVVNYDLPNISETYVHRIGRTGRAKASGKAISFCDLEERPYLKGIEKLIKQQVPVIKDHPYVDTRKDSEIVGLKKPSQGNRNNKPKSNKKPGQSGNKNVWNRRKPRN
ncbi:DEAD/DEAH box helicase [Crocinitomix catalasitica]|uniref:DEAD/DEAH box helicase n=1 Tax=Crocinitomix catalasitica TaxID=184607 RepID=UPI000565E94C|nr:DEAD/DEAH box helicase [Crocinitomix catalasitica]